MNETAGSEEAAQRRPVAELGYAEASAELDSIVRELDQGLVDVDLLEARFRRAIDVIEELDRRIRGARQRVDALMPRLDALRGGTEADSQGADH